MRMCARQLGFQPFPSKEAAGDGWLWHPRADLGQLIRAPADVPIEPDAWLHRGSSRPVTPLDGARCRGWYNAEMTEANSAADRTSSAAEADSACGKCGWPVGLRERECIVCKIDVGFPNVRFASRECEKSALAERFERARADLLSPELFEECCSKLMSSSAVMNRKLGPLFDWVNGQQQLFSTFHRQVQAGHRAPARDGYDQQRQAAESTISPYFFEDLNIAALSLDGHGMEYYGPYTVELRDSTFAHRASVFTENPFRFAERYQVTSGSQPPFGHRAPWNQRHLVAMAKVAPQLGEGVQLADVLMSRDRNSDQCDFVEVHIFGSLHASSIARVTGPAPADPEDAILWRRIKRLLGELGADVVETL